MTKYLAKLEGGEFCDMGTRYYPIDDELLAYLSGISEKVEDGWLSVRISGNDELFDTIPAEYEGVETPDYYEPMIWKDEEGTVELRNAQYACDVEIGVHKGHSFFIHVISNGDDHNDDLFGTFRIEDFK